MDPIQAIANALEMSGRLDSSESLFFARQLEYVKAQMLEIQYPEFKARSHMPVSNEADPGAETITYRMIDQYGHAKLQGNRSNDTTGAGVIATEYTQQVYGYETHYEYTTQDIRRATRTGTNLDMLLAAAARRAMEESFDYYAYFGNTTLGTTGLLNHASIPLVVLPNLGAWSGLTPQQMLDNLYAVVSSIPQTTNSIHYPDTLILDDYTHATLSQTNVGLDNQKTVLRSFLENNPYIKNIDVSYRCNTAGAGSIRRIVCYKRDPMVLQLNIPMEMTSLPPQAVGTTFRIPCEGRIGGLELRYPKAVAHADIATS